MINGEKRSVEDFGAAFGDGFAADNCDFVETKFETFDGPTEKVTVDFPNCEPNATEPSKVTTEFSKAVGQGEGTYTETEQGAGGGLFGFLSGSWVKHKGTTGPDRQDGDGRRTSEQREVPVGKVLHVDVHAEDAAHDRRMAGAYRRPSSRPPPCPPAPSRTSWHRMSSRAPSSCRGPRALPVLADGISKAVLEDC